MAKLYCKVDSDIRAGLGVRGGRRIESNILFSYSGARTADGGVRVIATETKGGYSYKIMQLTPDGEKLYGALNFNKEGR